MWEDENWSDNEFKYSVVYVCLLEGFIAVVLNYIYISTIRFAKLFCVDLYVRYNSQVYDI